MAQYGPHRFSAGRDDDGHNADFRGATFKVRDLTGARFIDCDMTKVRIVDACLVDVDISGYVERLVVNGVDVTDFVAAELDSRNPERVQFRQAETADEIRALWDTVERLWSGTVERAQRLPEEALHERVDDEWSFVQTLRHLIFITDAWASRTILDQERPYHPLGLPQTWYPPQDAAALGIDIEASPKFAEVLKVRGDRMTVIRRIVDALTDSEMERICTRSPAPGYPHEDRPVLECIAVVIDEELEHHRFATRDLAVLEGVRASR
jgi:DinB superfamily/Pentapeptide repeats (8 copies)